jgi:hypothetical protein
MRRMVTMAVVALLGNSLPAPVAAQSVDDLVAQAVTPLPDDLRAGATVVTYDPATGARRVLRQGTNFIECQPRNPADGFTRCYNKVLGPRRDLEAKLRAQGKSDDEISAAVAAAMQAGTLPARPKGMMSYRLYDKPDRIQNLWVMSVPNATTETIGVSTKAQRDAALKGQGLPWLMRPGTAGAHVMIPINPPPTRSTITDVAADEISQAVLPLPEDLRAGATVYKYDSHTGARIVLRQGTNGFECQPRDPETLFTRCSSTVTGPRRDLQAKLRAEGKSAEEISAALVAATKAGTIKSASWGTMSYRLYGKDDRIRLLWVMSVPSATPESIGVSTAPQRDNALKNDGRPWLMRAGTPGAHIMIPINK